jgi:hypothetical protein
VPEFSFGQVRGDAKTIKVSLPGADLQGARAMYVAWDDSDPMNANVIEKSILDGGIEWHPEVEELWIPFLEMDTFDLIPGTPYRHELEVRDVFNQPTTLFNTGTFVLEADRIRTQP